MLRRFITTVKVRKMISNVTVKDTYTTLLSAGSGVRLANVGMYFCNNWNRPNVVSIYALQNNAQPSKANVLAYNVAVAPSETFYFGQEKFILDEGERLVAKVGVGSMTSTMTFMSIGSSDYSSNAQATATLNGNGVGTVVLTSPGAGYTSPPTVTFTGGGGQGAQATAGLTPSGGVAVVNVTTPGAGYTSPPTVGLTGGNNPVIQGCTDPAATNYNHLATIDDSSCEYSLAVTRKASITHWWKFDEKAGSRATDSVGNIVGDIRNPETDSDQWVPGKRNNSLHFNGLGGENNASSGNYMELSSGHNSLKFEQNPFSISFWVKSEWQGAGDVGNMVLMSSGKYYSASGTQGNFVLGTRGSPSNPRVCFFGYNGNDIASQIGTDFSHTNGNGDRIDILDGAWHHILLSSSGSVAKIYVDGVLGVGVGPSAVGLQGETFFNYDYPINDGFNNGIYFGFINWNWLKWDGLIDDIRIYNVELSGSEVQSISVGDWSGNLTVAQGTQRVGPTSLSLVVSRNGDQADFAYAGLDSSGYPYWTSSSHKLVWRNQVTSALLMTYVTGWVIIDDADNILWWDNPPSEGIVLTADSSTFNSMAVGEFWELTDNSAPITWVNQAGESISLRPNQISVGAFINPQGLEVA